MNIHKEARSVGLQYTTDEAPGISRQKSGKGFAYFDPSGQKITDRKQIARFKALVIPPAWTQVWICPNENGYLQVTGRDAKGRKQAIYHPDWRELREKTKFDRLAQFGEALPKIRKQVDRDLRSKGLTKRKVVAAIVRLLETTLIRVGNHKYLMENGSAGLTTLTNRQVEVGTEKIHFRFKGKSGKFHEISISDRRIASIARRCQELPGQQLFEYIDDDGELARITSADVNEYLKSVTGGDFTAKDFRTWVATIEAIRLVREDFPEAKSAQTQLIKAVAQKLGNTVAVCRRSYIHPRVLEFRSKCKWVTCPMPIVRMRYLDAIEKLALKFVLT